MADDEDMGGKRAPARRRKALVLERGLRAMFHNLERRPIPDAIRKTVEELDAAALAERPKAKD